MNEYEVKFYNTETKDWETLLTGLTYEGAQNHAKMYKALFKTETVILLRGLHIDIE